MLKHNTFYKTNRLFLLVALIISISLPLIPININSNASNYVENYNRNSSRWLSTSHISDDTTIDESAQTVEIENSFLKFDFWIMMKILYALVALILFIRLIFGIAKILNIRRESEVIEIDGETFFLNPKVEIFTFFNWVFIPSKEVHALILKHENVHKNELHSLDTIFIELIKTLFWFNPIVYFIKKELLSLHEFLADNQVVKHHGVHDKITYLELLWSNCTQDNQLLLTSPFLRNNIKQRIEMLSKRKSHWLRKWNYLVMIPLVGLAIVLSASQEVKKIDERIFIEEIQTNNPPKAYPLLAEDMEYYYNNKPFLVGFGMRQHPILKTKKMHNGIDFRAPMGTKVLSTASGEVIETGDYDVRGMFIEIKHDEDYVSKYHHLSLISVKKGQKVELGMKIGEVGSSGASTAPHLHYEVHKGGKAVDPSPYLPKLAQE